MGKFGDGTSRGTLKCRYIYVLVHVCLIITPKILAEITAFSLLSLENIVKLRRRALILRFSWKFLFFFYKDNRLTCFAYPIHVTVHLPFQLLFLLQKKETGSALHTILFFGKLSKGLRVVVIMVLSNNSNSSGNNINNNIDTNTYNSHQW